MTAIWGKGKFPSNSNGEFLQYAYIGTGPVPEAPRAELFAEWFLIFSLYL